MTLAAWSDDTGRAPGLQGASTMGDSLPTTPTMNNKFAQIFGTIGFPTGVAVHLEMSSEVNGFSRWLGRRIFQFSLKNCSAFLQMLPLSPGRDRGTGGENALQFSPPSYSHRGGMGTPLALVPQRSGVSGPGTLEKPPQHLRCQCSTLSPDS